MYGKKDWFFPDAELPPRGTHPDLPGHESAFSLRHMCAQVAHVTHSAGETLLHFPERQKQRACGD